MDVVSELNREILGQDSGLPETTADELQKYRDIALSYACVEKSIAVLSDMRKDVSYIYYGSFAETLGIRPHGMGVASDTIDSIWEKDILERIHPEELQGKYLLELEFLRFIRRQPRELRGEYCLADQIHMRDSYGNSFPVLHRLFYISDMSGENLWLTLCLYNPLMVPMPCQGMAVNLKTGQVMQLDAAQGTGILSDRETQVLRLIDRGMDGKGIAGILSISINTVNRHRQSILAKLQVRNSIEACRIARRLGVI